MNHRTVPVVGAVILSFFAAAGVAASTGGELSPPSASPGALVTYENGCLGIVDDAPREARVGFSRTGDAPAADLPMTTAKAHWTFHVSVREFPPWPRATTWHSSSARPRTGRRTTPNREGRPRSTVLAGVGGRRKLGRGGDDRSQHRRPNTASPVASDPRKIGRRP